MPIELFFLLLALVYILAGALAYATTEPAPRDGAAKTVAVRRRRSTGSRILSWSGLTAGLLLSAKGLLLILGPDLLARHPMWVQILAGSGAWFSDILPGLVYLAAGVWLFRFGAAEMLARQPKRRARRPKTSSGAATIT